MRKRSYSVNIQQQVFKHGSVSLLPLLGLCACSEPFELAPKEPAVNVRFFKNEQDCINSKAIPERDCRVKNKYKKEFYLLSNNPLRDRPHVSGVLRVLKDDALMVVEPFNNGFIHCRSYVAVPVYYVKGNYYGGMRYFGKRRDLGRASSKWQRVRVRNKIFEKSEYCSWDKNYVAKFNQEYPSNNKFRKLRFGG